MSLGVSVDVVKAAAEKAKIVIAQVILICPGFMAMASSTLRMLIYYSLR